MMNRKKTEWIGVDWGTSNLRVYAVDSADSVLSENQSSKGMSTLDATEYEPALLELIEPWLSDSTVTPVYACGMVGARQGWKEAQYREVPCLPVHNQDLTDVPTQDTRMSVKILPGLCQQQPADVMRGEETQIAGLLKLKPGFQGAICLPGTHSKWVSVSDGIIESFKTFMTGELFSLLSNQSILKHSVSTSEWNVAAFSKAALNSVHAPEKSISELFSIRASSLLQNANPSEARARLSGMLIGQELGLAKDYWKDSEVALIGAPDITSMYAETLTKLGVDVNMFDAKQVTLTGLGRAVSAVNG